MRTPDNSAKHPLGGTFEFFTLPSGRTFSVLGDGYPHFDDYEILERQTGIDEDADGLPDVIWGNEWRAPSRAAALELIEALGAS